MSTFLHSDCFNFAPTESELCGKLCVTLRLRVDLRLEHSLAIKKFQKFIPEKNILLFLQHPPRRTTDHPRYWRYKHYRRYRRYRRYIHFSVRWESDEVHSYPRFFFFLHPVMNPFCSRCSFDETLLLGSHGADKIPILIYIFIYYYLYIINRKSSDPIDTLPLTPLFIIT